jgi:hypothetical protein
MTAKRWSSPLCVACQSITLEMFKNGFEHPLDYPQVVEMGKTCKLCRLIVCSISHLQTTSADRYQVNLNYDLWALSLPRMPYLVRYPALSILRNDYPRLVERVDAPPRRIVWKRQMAITQRYINGEFNDGNTIQISAPKGKQIVHCLSVGCSNHVHRFNIQEPWLFHQGNRINCR